MFISMRWKAIALTSLLLVGLSGYFIVASEQALKRLLESERQEIFLNYQNEIAGLLRQSYDHLLQLSDIIPILQLQNTDTGREVSDKSLKAIIDQHWSYIALNWGMESALLFDEKGLLQGKWGLGASPRSSDVVIQVLQTGAPFSRLTCFNVCQQVVTLPILAPDGQVMVLELSTSLADTLRAFQKITQADIGLLVPDVSIRDMRVVTSWSRTLAAMTNLERSMDMLQHAATQVSFDLLNQEPKVFQKNGHYHEVSLVSLVTESFGDAHFIIIEDVTDQHQHIIRAKEADIRTALTAILLSGFLVIFALWSPILRLRRHAEVLPILVAGDFTLLREKLGDKRSRRLFKDELDILDDAERDVADQLEEMQRQIEEDNVQLESLALYDPLTKLANRHLIFKEIQLAVKESALTEEYFSLLYLDLDNFKRVNDSLGHSTGDELLKVAARRLQASVRDGDIVARLGGDEFCILIKYMKFKEDSARVAKNILKVLGEPIHLGTTEFNISASIGIVTISEHGVTTEQLLQNADIAMYRAKAKGRSNFQYYTKSMSVAATERMALETELRKAIAEQQFELHYQPQINLETGKIVSAEALVRWIHPTRGLVSPDDFIPLLEETGLIIPLGEWIIHQAFKDAKRWNGLGDDSVNIAVNLSPRQFSDPELPRVIRDAMLSSHLQASQIEIEITESMVMNDIEKSNQLLKYLKVLGVTVAVDDFGTGHSSLGYLKKLDLDVLKVDRTFVQDLPDDENDKAIVAAIIAMAHELKLRVVAEGIESLEQEAFLKSHGCETGQGYLYSKPLPYEKFLGLLRRSDNIIPFQRSK
ncbi:MAG: EAL domain-containing protein [Pseudomonadales bacterium]